MPDRRDPPPTEEGWYVLHDFRTIDWDAWREAPERDRLRALTEAVNHLEPRLDVEDAEEGASAMYSIIGHKADFLLVHLRPSSAHLDALERQFECTEFARYTERATSFFSVTEASGYSEQAREYFDGELDENSGLANYIRTRLYPTIPDATHVCFYPMNKRRQPGGNWYDLPFEERAEHMAVHGDIGRDYGGRVVQMITGAIALDDWEWGVTLWGDDLVDMKDLLYEMRFDPSTSQFAEFGHFYVGRRMAASDLSALLAGEPVPADGDVEMKRERTEQSSATPTASHNTAAVATGYGRGGPGQESDDETPEQRKESETTDGDGDERGSAAGSERGSAGGTEDRTFAETERDDGATDHGSRGGSRPPTPDDDEGWVEDESVDTRLAQLGIHQGDEYEQDGYGLVLYSDADAQELADEVADLRGNFDHYDSHLLTTVRAQGGRSAVVSLWDSERAATTAHGFLQDLSGVSESYGGPIAGVETGSADDAGSTDGEHDRGEGHAGHAAGGADDIREELAEMDVYAGQPHGEDVYALVLYSGADRETLETEVEDLSDGFDRYDTHEGTTVYEDPEGDTAAVVSLWETADAAETASSYLADLPGVVRWADEGEGFATMGMFYTVKPDYREEFVGKFGTVAETVDEMDGHRETTLLVNTDDENDMFIASRWDSREDAMAFFRSDEFAQTVDWGRDVLADKPRHVFLA